MLSEDLLSAAQACTMPGLRDDRTGEPMSVKRFYALLRTGAKSVTGETVVLESIRTAGGLRTSKQAIDRFIARLSGARTIVSPIRRAMRERQISHALDELAACGML
jgi:hypothetical protein